MAGPRIPWPISSKTWHSRGVRIAGIFASICLVTLLERSTFTSLYLSGESLERGISYPALPPENPLGHTTINQHRRYLEQQVHPR